MSDEYLMIGAGEFDDRELAGMRDYADGVASDEAISWFARALFGRLSMACRDLLLARANRRVAELSALSAHGFPDWQTCVDNLPPS